MSESIGKVLINCLFVLVLFLWVLMSLQSLFSEIDALRPVRDILGNVVEDAE